MIQKIIGLALISPVWALACPNVGGTYTCKVEGFTKQVVISQSNRGGVTVYQVDGGGEIFADGVRHQTPNLHPALDKQARNYSYVAECNGNTLSFEGVADLVRGGQGQVDGALELSGKTVNIRLHLVTPDGDYPLRLTCQP